MITRVSTLSAHLSTQRNFNKVQADLATLQEQISSGIKTRRFDGMVGDIEEFVGLESKIKRIDTYRDNTTEALSRLRVTRNSLEGVIEITDDIQNLMTLRRNGAFVDNIAFNEQMRAKRETLINEINVQLEGRYLFSGTRTDTPPIPDPIPSPAELGVADDSFYQGSKENSSFRAQDNYIFSYNVRADDEAFQNAFGGIAMAIEAHTQDDEAMMTRSLDMLQDGLKGMISLQTRADSDIVNMELIQDRHESSKIYFQGIAEEIINTDVLAASTEVAIDQTILQATFQTFAKLSSLTLGDFLR